MSFEELHLSQTESNLQSLQGKNLKMRILTTLRNASGSTFGQQLGLVDRPLTNNNRLSKVATNASNIISFFQASLHYHR